jgi:hypothetical protein
MERKVVTRDRRGEIVRTVEHEVPLERFAFWTKVFARFAGIIFAAGFTFGAVFTWLVVRGIR